MPDAKRVYQEQAAAYEALLACEDYEGRLRPVLWKICPWEGLDVVDMGAGTGRLAVMMAPEARSMAALDLAPHMLAVARERLRAGGWSRWATVAADHRALPLADARADLVVSGWSIVYTVVWFPESWRRELRQALEEMRRLLRPGGTAIVIETLGTGETSPHPPQVMADYLDFLADAGFASTWLRTDYKFATREEAARLTGFFFGDEMIEKCEGDGPVFLPECTGIWWQQF